jgi:hypothetical protein
LFVLPACWTPPGPGLCWSCVGRSSPASRRACTPDPALSHRHARLPAARRPAAVGTLWPADHPVYPSARPGITHRDKQSMRRRTKSTHNDYLLRRRLGGRSQARSRCPVLSPPVVRQGSPGQSESGACPGSCHGTVPRLNLVPARFRPGCPPDSGSARCAPRSRVVAVPRDSAGHDGRR